MDFSKKLLNDLRKQTKNKNIKLIEADALNYPLGKNKFDIIIFYFSIQHFSERDAFILIEKCIRALKKGGRFLIGDIPDNSQKWAYISKPEYHRDYFQRLKQNRPLIGTWFDKK